MGGEWALAGGERALAGRGKKSYEKCSEDEISKMS